jgi:hypothetical protein
MRLGRVVLNHMTTATKLLMLAVALVAVATAASLGLADSTPVGPLPAGPTSTIETQKGQLVAVALPRKASGRVWRIARTFNAKVVRQVSEANVGPNVVLVFRVVGSGTTRLVFGLTRGETAKAFEARRFVVRAR